MRDRHEIVRSAVRDEYRHVIWSAQLTVEKEDPFVIQSWLIGLNPELGDRVPLRLMRENDLESVAWEIMGAARSFLVGG